MIAFTREEKERIFVGRTQSFYPENWAKYEELVSHEKWTREQMVAYNFAKRLEMLRYAYEKSPFYKWYYDSLGFRPEDVKTEADWEQVPMITKDHMREHGERRVVESERAHLYRGSTGGSTGVPCPTFLDLRPALTSGWRTMGWASGRAVGEVYPTPNEVLGQDFVRINRLDEMNPLEGNRIGLRYYPMKIFRFDCQLVSETLLRHIDELTKLEEDSYVLRGYTGSVYQIAKYAVEHQIHLPRALAVISGSSVLSPNMRAVIDEAFRCPVTDRYASEDFGLIAQEHRLNVQDREVHYVNSDLLHLELVDDANRVVPDGEDGLTVLTSLVNLAAPLIRFRQGDRTHRVVTPDPLGMPFDRIGAIQGRETDWIIGKDGSRLYAFSGIFHDYPSCARAFQYRQKVDGAVRLLVVPNKDNPNADAEIETCVETFRKPLEGKLDVTLEKVDYIPDDAGKLRCFVREK